MLPGRLSMPHYGSCPSVCSVFVCSVRASTAREQKGVGKPIWYECSAAKWCAVC